LVIYKTPSVLIKNTITILSLNQTTASMKSVKESEKNVQKHSYLSELYTPTRSKEQHFPSVDGGKKESEAAPVTKKNSVDAENYLNLIG
jgi:hypothetical protein